jgi:hypothetical protein
MGHMFVKTLWKEGHRIEIKCWSFSSILKGSAHQVTLVISISRISFSPIDKNAYKHMRLQTQRKERRPRPMKYAFLMPVKSKRRREEFEIS